MLDFQVQQFPFRFGLAEGVEPHLVPPGTLTTAENAMWLKAGRLQKRFGTAALPASIVGGGSIAAGARIFTRGSELCLTNGTRLYSYAEPLAAWRNVGALNEVIPTWEGALDTQSGIASCDVAYLNGVLYYLWTTGDPWLTNINTDLWFQAVSATTGAVLRGPSRIFTGTTFGARCLVSGTGITLVTRTGAVSPYSIQAVYFDTLTFTFLQPMAVLKNDNATVSSVASWDACMTQPDKLVIAYNRTGNTIALESFTIPPTGIYAAAASGTVIDPAGCKAVGIDGITGERLYVVYCKGGGAPNAFQIAINDATTLAPVVGTTNINTPVGGFGISVGVARFDATRCVCWVNINETQVLSTTTYLRTSTGAAFFNNVPYYSALSTTRPFVMGGKAYVGALLLERGAFGANSCLLSADEYRYLGTIDLLVAGTPPLVGGTPSGVPATSATTAATTMLFQSSVTPTQTNWRQGVKLVTFNYGASKPSDAYRSISINQEGITAGGCVIAYDGRGVFDYGFASAPVLESTTVTGSGSIAAGTYLYSAVSEFRSSTGLYYRSPAAVAISQTTTTASSTNTIAITNCNVSNKPNNVLGFLTEGIYRTVADGTVPQRLSFEPRFNTVFVDRNIEIQTFVDTRSDASIDGLGTTLASRPALYTTGGILDDFAPPANITQCFHVDRLWVLAGDKKTWWYSKTFQDDLGTAPGFHPTLRISFAEVQTAMASMDDKAIFFSATGVKYMLGTGPAPTGLGSDFQTPTTIQSDVGCTNARSVVPTPDGIMFLSARGIYLLDRGLQLSWIGRPIKDTLELFPDITSAVLVAEQNQVRFTCVSDDGLSGRTLVYDYVEKQWSTFQHWVDGVYGGPIADACMWNGAWTFVSANGIVQTENPATHLDSGTNYAPMVLETAWMSADGPLSFKSMRTMHLNGVSNTNHDLTIEAGFDSNSTYQQTLTFPAESAVTSIGDLEECGVIIGTRRKCGTIRFRVSDATPTTGAVGTGQGPSFYMMALEIGMKRGPNSTPATKRG